MCGMAPHSPIDLSYKFRQGEYQVFKSDKQKKDFSDILHVNVHWYQQFMSLMRPSETAVAEITGDDTTQDSMY